VQDIARPITVAGTSGAIVVAVHLIDDERDRIKEDLDELESLLLTLGIPALGRVIQRRQKFVARSLLGSGKVEEIKELAGQVGATMVVFDRELSPMQVRNLEKMSGLQVLDRTGIILQIFSQHARTTQAKTQVEIARLEYMLPRLSGAWTHFQRQTGRGMGEKQIEVDRRQLRDRIARLQKQLDQIRRDKQNQSKARQHELKVALVGYTNSGKTTLMNTLTKAQLKAKDELFATLDTSVKVIDPRTRPKILLSDTVGFIRNLPHSLVESFKSTLDEVREAHLLLHVVDISFSNYRDHIEITKKVLDEIGAGNVPQIIVFNKMDLIDDPLLPRILKKAYPNSIVVSAQSREDAVRLREHIYHYFENDMVQAKLKVAHSNHEAISLIYNLCLVLDSNYESNDDIIFEVKAAKPTIAKLAPYVISI